MADDRRRRARPGFARLLGGRRRRILLALAVLLIAFRAALPEIVRRVAIRQADQALAGRIELDDVDLALVTGGITLHGLRVFANESAAAPVAGEKSPPARHAGSEDAPPSREAAGADAPADRNAGVTHADAPAPEREAAGTAPVFSATRLSVDLGLLALFRKTIEVQEIDLDGFAVAVDRTKSGTVVLPRPVATDAEPPPQAEGSGWGVLVQRVTLRDGHVGVRDFAVGDPPQRIDVQIPTIDAANLALQITDRGPEPGKMALDAELEDGGLHVDATIESLAAGPAVETHVVVTSLPIGDARLYVPHVGWSDLAGRLDADLVHRFESQGAHTLRGTVGLRDLAVRVPGLDDPALSWRALTVDVGAIDLVKQHADVDAVTLAGLRVVAAPAGPDPLPVLRGLLAAAKPDVARAAPPAGASTGAASVGAVRQSTSSPTEADAAASGAPPRAPDRADARPSDTAPAPTPAAQPSDADRSPAAGAAPAAAAAAPAAAGGTTPVKPWSWTVGKVVLDDAVVKTLGGDAPLEVAMHADVERLASAPDTHTALHLSIAPSSGGTLALDGDAVLQPIAFDGTLRLDGLALAPLTSPVATARTRLLRDGRASAELTIAVGATAKAPDHGARVAGHVSVDDLEVAGDDPKAFALRWKELAIVLRDVSAPGLLASDPAAGTGPIAAALASVTLTRPEIVATRTDRGIALPDAIAAAETPRAADTSGRPAPADAESSATAAQPAAGVAPPAQSSAAASPAPPAGAAPAAPPLDVQVRVDRLAVRQLSVSVTDKAVQPFYRSTLDPVDLTATDVRWPGPFARDVKLVAKGLDGATFVLTGDVAPAGSRLTAKLDRLPLAPFNPYAAASGYAIGGGTAHFESRLELRGNGYDSTSKLVLNKLDVRGSEGESLFAAQFGMPLSLALSLLTDLQGNIVLELPIAGDEAGMHVAFGTIIANALSRAILHAVTSPLKLIGAVASIGDKPASLVPPPIVFAPGRDVLAPGEAEKLAQLGKLLAAAPGLKLHLRGETSKEDRRWLKEQALRAKLESERGVMGTLRHITERGERAAVLEVLTARADGKAAAVPEEHAQWFEEQVDAQQVPDAVLHQLAATRAATLQADLERDHGIAKGRVLLDATEADDLDARPVVAIGLGAEAARTPPAPPASSAGASR